MLLYIGIIVELLEYVVKDNKLTKHVTYTMSYTRFPGPYNNTTVLFYCIVGLKYYGKGSFIL